MADRNSNKSYVTKAGWYMALILAAMVAFAGTGPLYHATAETLYRFAVSQYGYVIADFAVLVWWAGAAFLLFFSALVMIVMGFRLFVFIVGRLIH